MEHRERKASLFGPLLLISIGAILLLNNLGVLEWNIWLQMVNWWPILLIVAGLDLLLGRRSIIGSLIVAALLIGLLAGGVWYLTSQTTNTSLHVEQISYPLQGVERADVHIGFGVGTLQLGTLYDSDRLIEGQVDLGKNETLVAEHQVKGNKATLSLDSKTSTPLNYSGNYTEEKTWTLNLNSAIEVSLDVNTGVGTAWLDLRRLVPGNLSITTGVGKTTLILPQRGRFQVKIKAGVGEVIVEVPEGLGVKITADAGLGGMDIPDGYRRSGDTYTSSGYHSADDRADIEIDGGVGRIVIRESRGE